MKKNKILHHLSDFEVFSEGDVNEIYKIRHRAPDSLIIAIQFAGSLYLNGMYNDFLFSQNIKDISRRFSELLKITDHRILVHRNGDIINNILIEIGKAVRADPTGFIRQHNLRGTGIMDDIGKGFKTAGKFALDHAPEIALTLALAAI